MPDPYMFPFCREFYVVEKSIEVVVTMKGDSRCVRINALHDLKQDHYCARVYIEESVFLEPEYPANDESGRREPASVWTAWTDFPWTHGNSAEQALRSALSFLRERCPTAAA
jgi:hypothetical protein